MSEDQTAQAAPSTDDDFDISTLGAAETATIELFDTETNEPLVSKKTGKPITVTVYGPGSKQYAAAVTHRNNNAVKRYRRKGKTDETPEEATASRAAFLAAVTVSFNNFGYKGLPQGRETFRAAYADLTIGWLGDQVFAEVNDWGNFKKAPASA